MLDHSVFTVVGGQIIIFLPPDQGPGTDAFVAVWSGHQLLFKIPVQVDERDLLIFLNSPVDRINAVINALILRLDSSGHIDLSLQFTGIVFPGDLLQLPDQFSGFFRGDKPGRLYRVHQQL